MYTEHYIYLNVYYWEPISEYNTHIYYTPF